MSPRRTDTDGRLQVGPTWESIVERQIREAMEEGAFDDLPFRGEPLPVEGDAAAGEWALAFLMLRNAGAAPPWIEADKDARAWLARRDGIRAAAGRAGPLGRSRLRAELERVVREANRAIERVNAEAPSERQHRRMLDLDAELAALDVPA